MCAGTKPVASTCGSTWEEIISFSHPAKGFTPLWECFELAGNLDREIKNPGFESRNAISGKKENLAVLCEFFFCKSRPSVMSSFQMCHKNSFHRAYFCFVMRRVWVWLYVLAFFGWAHFLFDRVFISSELLQFPCGSDGVLVAHDQKEQESFRVWGCQRKRRSPLWNLTA